MSLPFLLNLDLNKPPLVNTINSDLLVNKKNIKDKNFKIGLAWSGNQNYQFDIMRSIKLESLEFATAIKTFLINRLYPSLLIGVPTK